MIVLVAVSTFWMGPEDVKLRFPLGKDLLAIIIGVLGTILGFYYGSAGFGTAAPQALTISELAWNQESLPSGSKASIAGKLSGGTPPYQVELRYQPCWVEQVTKSLPTIAKVNGNSFIVEFNVPVFAEPESLVGFTVKANEKSGAALMFSGGALRFRKP
ncbi:hypothetical protein NKI95_26070 [Mesorhizobium sp. M0306]|uniref:hypothetical protein n=1 Tax=Mesorhizobium sp. M0306 TaxID=2956932 RepID=UPI00333DEB52